MQTTNAAREFLKDTGLVLYVLEGEGVDINPGYPQRHFRIWVEGERHSFDTDWRIGCERPEHESDPPAVLAFFARICAKIEGRTFDEWAEQNKYSDNELGRAHWSQGQQLLDNMRKATGPDWGRFLAIHQDL